MKTRRNGKKTAALLIAAAAFALLAGCSPAAPQEPEKAQMTGQIILLGEAHYNEKMQQKELEIWSIYYNEYGMRDLFIEFPSYVAEYLNVWMQSDNDDILYEIYGAYADHPSQFLDFFLQIKSICPETVFHGTDMGLPEDPQGILFLEYLTAADLTDSESYRLTQERMQQGAPFYPDWDWTYRETIMVENFIQEMETIGSANIMGIYGASHTDVNATNHDAEEVPSMARQLQDKYGDDLHIRDLCFLKEDEADPFPDEPYPSDPPQPDAVTVNGKDYAAQYFGKAELSVSYPEYQYREFWLLEDAYNDFKNNRTLSDPLPYDGYPVEPAAHQVYVMDCTKTDGSVERTFYRCEKAAGREGTLFLKQFDAGQ